MKYVRTALIGAILFGASYWARQELGISLTKPANASQPEPGDFVWTSFLLWTMLGAALGAAVHWLRGARKKAE